MTSVDAPADDVLLVEAVDAIRIVRLNRPAEALGSLMIDLFAVRCASSGAVRELAESGFMGPAAAPDKVLLSDAEQHVYDFAQRVLGADLVLDRPDRSVAGWQEDYLFSRAVTVYGGTRQIQLTTIARFLLGVGQ